MTFTFFPGLIFHRQLPNKLLIRRISFLYGIIYLFALKVHCFCLTYALSIISTRYFRFYLSGLSLHKVSLPVAFDSYYLNRMECHGGTTPEYGTTLRFLLPIMQFFRFLLRTASKKCYYLFKDFL